MQEFRFTKADKSPLANAMRDMGIWKWAKEVRVGREYSFINDGSEEYQYTTPPGLFACLIEFYSGGKWTIPPGELIFGVPSKEDKECKS